MTESSDLDFVQRDVVGFLEARAVSHMFVIFVEDGPDRALYVRE
jgi:hypothetical protein